MFTQGRIHLDEVEKGEGKWGTHRVGLLKAWSLDQQPSLPTRLPESETCELQQAFNKALQQICTLKFENHGFATVKKKCF